MLPLVKIRDSYFKFFKMLKGKQTSLEQNACTNLYALLSRITHVKLFHFPLIYFRY